MFTVPLSDVDVRKRQRSTIPTTSLNELKDSILHRGLLHAPVMWLDAATQRWVLTVGERRLRAIEALTKDGQRFRHDGQEVPQGHIPITRVDQYLSEVGRFEAELDENTTRLDLDWQDRVRAFADLHEMRQHQNPGQTLRETGSEIIERGLGGTVSDSKTAEQRVSQAIVIAKHLDNEKIASARNPAEAYSLILKSEEERIRTALVRRQLASMPEKPLVNLRHGSLLEILPRLEPEQFDLIFADPPYGLGAGAGGFRARTVHHHNYEDTPEEARKIAQCILMEGFRLSKQRANLLMFCDIDLFDWLKVQAANLGWTPFRRPLIWQKSESEGLAPWGSQGPRITTEFLLYATKGRRGMTASPIDVFNEKRVPRQERLHAAEKPVELLKKLISCTTLPGDMVLDPCCGSGSSGVACREVKRQYLGIEKDQDYFNTAMANVYGQESKTSELLV